MNENPPFLEVNIVNMTLAEFQRNRRAKQHLAGQADHYGVAIGMERMDYSTGYEDDYPEALAGNQAASGEYRGME